MQNTLIKNDSEIVRGTDKNCNDCQKKFSIMTRQHQCKRCLKPVCSDCGNFRRQVYGSTFTVGEHRVCKNCKQSSTYIADLVKNQDLRFGQTKDTGKKWLKKMTSKPSTFGTDTSKHKIFTKQVFSELWGSYSFELRELVGMLTFGFKQDGVYNVVYNVYTTVISAAPQYNFNQVIHLIVYVLCFCSSDKAPFIVLYLLELKHNQKQFKSLVFSYLKAMPFKNQLSKLEQYINYRLERYSDSFLINCLTIECSKFLISKIFDKRNIQEMLIFFATHIYVNREFLLSKINQSKSLLDNIMLRNCKLEQLISNYRYFKGKNLSGSFIDPKAEDFQQTSLKRLKTINYDSSYSPKGQNSQYGNDRFKPKLIQRSPIEDNDRDKMDDSFSFYVEGEIENVLVKSPSQNSNKSSKNVEENDDFSPQIKVFGPSQDSPFKKSIQQDASTQLFAPLFPQLMKPVRKSTDGPQYDGKSLKYCQNCNQLQEQYANLLKKYSQEKAKWTQQNQSLQAKNEKISSNLEQSVTQDFAKKNKINQLEKINIQNQNLIKQTQQRLNKLQTERINIDLILQKSKIELKDVTEKLMAQTNENIKLSAALEKQKRNVKQARQMCIQTNKINQGLKQRLAEIEVLHSQCSQRQVNLNNKINIQQIVINENKQKVAELMLRQAQLTQTNLNNNQIQKQYLDQKVKVSELTQLNLSRETKLSQLQKLCEESDMERKKLNVELQSLSNRMQKIEQEMKFKTSENEKLKLQLQGVSTDNRGLKEEIKVLNLKKQQLEQDLKKNILLLNKINQQQTQKSTKLTASENKEKQSKELLEECETEIQRLRAQNNKMNDVITVMKVDLSKISDELLQTKNDQQQIGRQKTLLVQKLQLKSADFGKQIEILKRQKAQLQEKNKILLQQLDKQAKLNISLSVMDHSNSSNQNHQKILQIRSMAEQNEKEAKLIKQLKESLKETQEAKNLLNQRLLLSAQELKFSKQANEKLQQQLVYHRRQTQLMIIGCDQLKKQIDLRRQEMLLLKQKYEQRQNKEIVELKSILGRTQEKHQELLSKFSDISQLMMEIQQQKMELADELFSIHQYLRSKGIKVPK